MKPLIIISAERYFSQNGAVSMVLDCLHFLSQNYAPSHRIKALVYKKELYPDMKGVEYVEFPKARKNFLYRFYYEYYYFNQLSKKEKPFLWISLQDTTPVVSAENRILYFHNALINHKLKVKHFFLQPRLFLLTFLYHYVYPLGIHNNDVIVVQQHWFKQKIEERLSICQDKVYVVRPVLQIVSHLQSPISINKDYVFLYPATGYLYKNFEVIFAACEILNKQSVHNFKILLTVREQENVYIRSLLKKYKKATQIELMGHQTNRQIGQLYAKADALLYSSKIESWGLPLSECMGWQKPMLVSDLPYAHETTENYSQVKFFDPNNPRQLAHYIQEFIAGNIIFDETKPSQPVKETTDWKTIFDKILIV